METSTSIGALARFGHALSDSTRARVLVALGEGPAFSGDLASGLGVSRQAMSNHLSCLRGCGLVVAVPEGRRARYELSDPRIGSALADLLKLVLVVDRACSCDVGSNCSDPRCAGSSATDPDSDMGADASAMNGAL